MAARQPPISETEMDVLKVLWEHGPATVRQVNAVLRKRGRRYAYTTVLTLLQRLEAKGHVTHGRGEAGLTFSAATDREQLISRRLLDVADKLCGGSLTPLLMNLVRAKPLSPRELDELRALLEDLRQPPRPRGKPR